MKPAKILYFIEGPVPTPADRSAADELGAGVVFRNATAVPSEPHSLEICDGVAGEVPELYKSRYPTADEAIAKKRADLQALSAKVGDKPAPKRGGKAAAPVAPTVPAAQPQPAQNPPAWNPNPSQ